MTNPLHFEDDPDYDPDSGSRGFAWNFNQKRVSGLGTIHSFGRGFGLLRGFNGCIWKVSQIIYRGRISKAHRSPYLWKINMRKNPIPHPKPPTCPFFRHAVIHFAVCSQPFSMDCQKSIRVSKIPREQPYQIWMWSHQRVIMRYRARKLFGLSS